MPTLAETQSKLRDAVVRGRMEDFAWRSALLVGGSNPEKRLTIRQRKYHRSLLDALLVKFPATAWLIGTPFLMEDAKRFVMEQPPQTPCIAESGAAFSDSLSRCPKAARAEFHWDRLDAAEYTFRKSVSEGIRLAMWQSALSKSTRVSILEKRWRG